MRDRAWIRLMVSGDKAAGEEFVRRYYARIERLLRCLTGSPDTARDLTQQTFVKAWQALPGFKHEASLQTWLHRIAYHEYTHWLRDRRDHAPLEAAHDMPDLSANTLVNNVVNDWGMALLPNALAQLSEDLRDTFLLFYVQELSVAEVASVMNAPRGTVKSRLFTARQKLRGLLEHAMREPDANNPKTNALHASGLQTNSRPSERKQAVVQPAPTVQAASTPANLASDIPAAYRVEPEPPAKIPLGQRFRTRAQHEIEPHSKQHCESPAPGRMASDKLKTFIYAAWALWRLRNRAANDAHNAQGGQG